MKKLLIEDEQEGLLTLMGKRITLFCVNYIYTGELVGVSDTCVKLSEAAIVFETGEFDSKEWTDAQALPHDCFYVQLSAVEAFGELK